MTQPSQGLLERVASKNTLRLLISSVFAILGWTLQGLENSIPPRLAVGLAGVVSLLLGISVWLNLKYFSYKKEMEQRVGEYLRLNGREQLKGVVVSTPESRLRELLGK